jgi:hypothetical protein
MFGKSTSGGRLGRLGRLLVLAAAGVAMAAPEVAWSAPTVAPPPRTGLTRMGQRTYMRTGRSWAERTRRLAALPSGQRGLRRAAMRQSLLVGRPAAFVYRGSIY